MIVGAEDNGTVNSIAPTELKVNFPHHQQSIIQLETEIIDSITRKFPSHLSDRSRKNVPVVLVGDRCNAAVVAIC